MTNSSETQFLIGGNGEQKVHLYGNMANRHGLVSGATGTGKTVTLQILAESFSNMGVPVFLADVKGDISGLSKPAKPHPKIDERINIIGIEDYKMQPSPVVFWDFLGQQGHPIRTTVSEIGPLLWSSLLDLNDTQTGVLYSCFKIADDNGWLILDLKDLRSMLTWMADNSSELKGEYGNISSSSIGAIQRGLIVLEEQGGENFLGEPAIQLSDLMNFDFSGRGVINVMDVTKVIHNSPKLYAVFLLWLMSELFENLPEVGDADKPKFVLFFDEAHLLFEDAPKVLVEKIEQVVRLIRSKGVGIYFISQNPLDIPQDILGQLGMKIQHALRAFTPKDKKMISAVADTFRANPNIDTESCITDLGIGEALVSVLDNKGTPTEVQRVLIKPPFSQIGPMTDEERQEAISRSPLKGKYDTTVDRESAYELLKERAAQQAEIEAEEEAQELAEKERIKEEKAKSKRSSGRGRQSISEALIKSAARSIGTRLGKQIIRGVLGSILR